MVMTMMAIMMIIMIKIFVDDVRWQQKAKIRCESLWDFTSETSQANDIGAFANSPAYFLRSILQTIISLFTVSLVLDQEQRVANPKISVPTVALEFIEFFS